MIGLICCESFCLTVDRPTLPAQDNFRSRLHFKELLRVREQASLKVLQTKRTVRMHAIAVGGTNLVQNMSPGSVERFLLQFHSLYGCAKMLVCCNCTGLRISIIQCQAPVIDAWESKYCLLRDF